MGIGEYIQGIRKSRGLSVNKLSILSTVSVGYINNLEREDNQKPTPEILKKLANAIQCNYYDLLEEAGYINKSQVANWVNGDQLDDQDMIEIQALYQSIPKDKIAAFLQTMKIVAKGLSSE